MLKKSKIKPQIIFSFEQGEKQFLIFQSSSKI
jgi:hypothetical protein